MARDGSGTYNLVVNSWYPPTNGVSATAVDWQTFIEDVAAALTQSVSADGQTPITGNLNMGGNKLTGLAAGTATGDSLRFQQLFDQGTEVDVASAATTDIGVQNSNFIRITGTTTITSFGTNYRGPRFVRFGGALTLTHNATTLILPTGANITTAAGDRAIITPIGNPASGWQVLAYQKADGTAIIADRDFLNTTRIDVASASTVNLTSSAPNTRNINITGTTTITAFTVAAGQTYFVRFDGILTLTNNANIVTNSGANITTSAGDTCILRATADNVVEVLSYVGRATAAQAQAGTDVSRLLTPSTLKSAQIQLGTLTNTSGGITSVDFTGIPSWAKRVNVILNGVSTNGTSVVQVQIGSGSVQTTGYSSQASWAGPANSTLTIASTTGFHLASGAAVSTRVGIMTIQLAGGNNWIAAHSYGDPGGQVAGSGGGTVTLSGALDRVRITTFNGTDLLDAGNVNISWE